MQPLLKDPVNWYWLVWALDGSLAAVFEGAPPQANSLRSG
jgi:hypothetical protein